MHHVSGKPVTLWGGQTYCRKCVEEVSPALYDFVTTGGELQDILDQNDVSAIQYMSLVGKWLLVGIMLFFVLPMGLGVLAGKADIWEPIFALAFSGGIGTILLSLKSFLGVAALRKRLPRKVTVKNGQLVITTPKKQKSVPLSDCKWYFGSTLADAPCMFTRLRQGVVIQTPENSISCGHSQDMLAHWRAFLSLTRIPKNPPHGCLWFITAAGAGMIIGLLVGTGIGCILSIITNNNKWISALGFIGFLQGPVVALIYRSCTSEDAAAARKIPALLGFVFFVIGMKFGVGAGLTGALICGCINAMLGVFVGWRCRAKINASEMERKCAGQLHPRHNERENARW